ncbi:MAG: DUF4112 domain-containing protein [Caulobacter sp.]|nr:DUF4112 domain-containing protein [Caulobacter sp.]
MSDTSSAEILEGYVVDDGVGGHRHRAHKAWRNAETIKRLSDRLIGLGPFGLGLDGVLAWAPGVGVVYSLGAGALLMGQAFSAKASAGTMARMAAYLLVDTATDSVWGLGSLVDTLFPGHLMAAKALQRDIEKRHGLPDEIDPKTRKARKPPKAKKGRR